MALFQGLFFSLIGLGLLAVAYQSLGRGWLPCGPNGFRGRARCSGAHSRSLLVLCRAKVAGRVHFSFLSLPA